MNLSAAHFRSSDRIAANLDFLLPNELLFKLLHGENNRNSAVDIGLRRCPASNQMHPIAPVIKDSW
jgi:hypothetical protein